MSWNNQEFVDRVRGRIQQLGVPEFRFLKEAGLDESMLRKDRRYGFRIDILQRLAKALGWSLGELLAIEPPSSELNPKLLAASWGLADRVIGDNPANDNGDRLLHRAEIAATIYPLLIDMGWLELPYDQLIAVASKALSRLLTVTHLGKRLKEIS